MLRCDTVFYVVPHSRRCSGPCSRVAEAPHKKILSDQTSPAMMTLFRIFNFLKCDVDCNSKLSSRRSAAAAK